MNESDDGIDPHASAKCAALLAKLSTESAAAVLSVVMVVAMLLWHGVRAAVTGWQPTGDDAYFTLRSLDVLSGEHPLLGAWSAGSVDLDRNVNNLGPMQLDLLAPFTHVDWAGGTAVGTVVVHSAAVLSIAWLMYRLGGPRQVIAGMAGVGLLTWMMGSELLITPQQHQFLMLSFLAALVATWAALVGDRWAPLVFVVAGSLALQTHLTYPILIAPLALVVVLGQASVWKAQPARRADLLSAWSVTLGVGMLLWAQTIIDQLFGEGNLGDVLTAPSQGDPPGLATGTRLTASVLLTPQGYLRPGLADFDPATAASIGDGSVVVLVLLLTVAGLSAAAYRAGRRRAGAGLAVASVVIAAAVANAALVPDSQFFGLRAENYRWLWVVAAFLFTGAVSLLVRRRPGLAVGLSVVGALALLNVPHSYQVADPDGYAASTQAVSEVVNQLIERLAALDLVGPVVIVQSEMYLGHRFNYPLGVVVAELGLDYRFEGAGQARRFGESRVADGTEPTRLVLRHGEQAVQRETASDTVAYVSEPVPVSVSLERNPES